VTTTAPAVAATTAPVVSTVDHTVGTVTKTATQAVGAVTTKANATVHQVASSAPKPAVPQRSGHAALPTTTPAQPPAHSRAPAPTAHPAKHHPQPAPRVKSLPNALSSTAAFAAPTTGRANPAGSAAHAPAAPRRNDRLPLPAPLNGLVSGSASSTGTALVLAILLAFVLAAPNAGRWLRPALALGLSPVTLSPDDAPG
jgi:hypothetical protein